MRNREGDADIDSAGEGLSVCTRRRATSADESETEMPTRKIAGGEGRSLLFDLVLAKQK